MKVVKLKTAGPLIAQVAAGQTVNAIVHNNQLYLPAFESEEALGGGGASDATPAAEAAPTGRKTRGAAAAPAAPAPVDHTAALTDIFKTLEENGDDGAALDAIVALTDDAGKQEQLGGLVSAFMADSNLTVEGQVAAAVTILSGGGAAPAGRRGRGAGSSAAAPAAKKSVEPSSLKVGDKVEVFFNENLVETPDWYKGEVTKVGRGGKPTFTFDDGDVLEYDADGMNEIRLQ